MNQPQTGNAGNTRIAQTYLSDLVGKARERYRVPAISVALMDADEIYRYEIQGVRVFGQESRVTSNDYFHIGSCSKSVLAIMAARLVEQKKLSWQTGFFDVFPEFRENSRNEYASITLEDLFLCQAGIRPFTNAATEPLPSYQTSVDNQRLEFIQYLVGLTPSSIKGRKRFQRLYSNPSYTMASAMLERVSGLSYEFLVKRTLTDDLGLTTHLGWPNSLGPGEPWGHMITGDKIEAYSPDNEYRIPYLLTPAGDLSMTPRGFARYTQLHLQGLRGASNYIGDDSYQYIHFAHKGFSLGVANGALGGQRFSGIDGSAGTFFCRAIIVPRSNLAFTIMMNAGSGSASMKAVDWLTQRIVKKHYNWWWRFWL
jgi:CubicO group peptidase (beta-lactamase class C family)